MKRLIIVPLILILAISSALAISLKIDPEIDTGVVIIGLKEPAIFNVNITNTGTNEIFKIYNVLGFTMAPSEEIKIPVGEKTTIQISVYPRENFDYRGFYTLQYFIKDSLGSETPQQLTFKIVDLKDVFEFGSSEIDPRENTMKIYLYNKENFNFKEINAKFSSAFFNFEQKLSLTPYEKKEFVININKEDAKKLMAGFYTMTSEITVEGEKAKVYGTLQYIEKDIVTSISKDYGLIVSTKTIKKTNEGNVISTSETTIKKNIISRLFTTFSPEPDSVERTGGTVYYSWKKEIKPGESLEIIVKTNWLFPFLIILLILIIVIIVKRTSKKDLEVSKKVSFVNAKGGEFALKVSIILHARKHVESVSLIDMLPPLVKVYERFGAEKPFRLDEKRKKIEWDIGEMNEGDKRIISYIIYSKIGVVGKFALPTATAVYEKDGKLHESISNRAFFVAEQRSKDWED